MASLPSHPSNHHNIHTPHTIQPHLSSEFRIPKSLSSLPLVVLLLLWFLPLAPPASAMASLKCVRSASRASPLLLHACLRCRCSTSHALATGEVCKRSMSNVAHLISTISVAANERPYSLSHGVAKWRPFHSSSCNSQSDEKKSSDTNAAISRAPDQLDGNNHQAQSGPESFADVPGTTNTQGKKLAIIYTCKVCNTRSAKQFTEHAYHHGVVLVRCPGCQNLHLIADRLGWFDDSTDGEDGKDWDVEKALKKAGENVKAVTGEDVLELTLDDVMGNAIGQDDKNTI